VTQLKEETIMGLRINQNIAATNAYRNLSVTEGQMQKSLEKLSSGFRINRAADDAAGLSISEGLRAQIGGLKVAVRNAQDGISVVQTAEGALTETHAILQRMRDLAVQASNSGSQDPTARQAAQTELDQLNQELDRIGSTTAFGAARLLDGTFGLQGASAKGTSQVDLTAVTATDSVTVQLSKSDGGSPPAATTDGSAVTVTPGGTYTNDGAGAAKLQKDLQTAIDATALKGKVTAQVQFDSLTNKASVSFNRNGAATTLDKLDVTGPASAHMGFDTTGVTGAAPTGNAASFQVGANNTAADKIAVSIGKVDSTTLGTSTIDLVNNAASAVDTLDTAISQVSQTRSNLGAYQNRFEHAINNLNVAVENVSASESRIRDTDMAAEMVEFTKSQILSQAGTAMLAQANQAPQSVLQLLK
jgi:flagellin